MPGLASSMKRVQIVQWRAVQILRLHLAAWQVTTMDKIHQRAQSTTALVWYAQQVSLSASTSANPVNMQPHHTVQQCSLQRVHGCIIAGCNALLDCYSAKVLLRVQVMRRALLAMREAVLLRRGACTGPADCQGTRHHHPNACGLQCLVPPD